MAGTDSIREAIEALILREKKLTEELTQVKVSIRTLRRAAGIELAPDEKEASEAAAVTVPESGFDTVATNGFGGKPMVRPDEFFGMTHAEASRRYLKKVGHAVSFEELVDVLQKGGCKLTGVDPKRVLYISLIRNSRDFIPPQPGFVGLREFYPRVKAMAETRPVHAKRGRPRKQGSAKKQQPRAPSKPGKTQSNGKPGELSVAVAEFMGDKQLHSPSEIADAVSKKLGRSIKRVSIHGALSSKKRYEQLDGKFRLAK